MQNRVKLYCMKFSNFNFRIKKSTFEAIEIAQSQKYSVPCQRTAVHFPALILSG